jgi:hypothetical protein
MTADRPFYINEFFKCSAAAPPSFHTRSAGKALARYKGGSLLGRLASALASFSALGLVPRLVRPPAERVVIEISVQCVSERPWGLRRVGRQKPDLDEEIDFTFPQFDRGAAKAAFSTIEGPVCPLG